jgi:glucose-1-phosphate thymidylyltransferase
MKGIILAGGTGSRLYPLTKVINKCLLPVGKEPMIYRMLDIFVKSNIDDIMLVTGPEHMGQVISLLGSGAEYNCSITYKVQDKANGIAAALKLCNNFANKEKFAVVLGDNIFSCHEKISNDISSFALSEEDYMLFAKKVPDPQRFGVPVYSNDKVIDIVEKPKFPPSDKAIVGLYCYTPEVFSVIEKLKPSARGEYEISDVNSWLIKNKQGSVIDIECEWIDAGTHDSYKKANELIGASF